MSVKMKEKQKYRIYLDTTKRYEKSVKLVEIENGKESVVGEKSGDLDVVSSIDELLKENDLKPKDIDEFVPNTGPGSFTGIKIGITIANILNWVLRRKSLKDLYKPNYGKEPSIQKTKKLSK